MNEAKKLCDKLKIIPTKRKGQNFLVNGKILEDIINAAELKPDDIILEIGPGLGVLTEELAQKAKKVIAVELDKKLAAFLKEKFSAKGGSASGGESRCVHHVRSLGKSIYPAEQHQTDINCLLTTLDVPLLCTWSIAEK
jgi:tRNA A58 N-methylase Trm61